MAALKSWMATTSSAERAHGSRGGERSGSFCSSWPYQLRRHKGEHTIPTHQELTAELARQHAAEFSGKVEAVGQSFDQYVRDAQYLEAAGQAIGRPVSELQQILQAHDGPRTNTRVALEARSQWYGRFRLGCPIQASVVAKLRRPAIAH